MPGAWGVNTVCLRTHPKPFLLRVPEAILPSLQIGIPKMPNVCKLLLSVRPPRGLAANILIDDDDTLSLKLNNFIIIELQTHQAAFMKDLIQRSRGQDVNEVRFRKFAKAFGDCCSKLALFFFEYANYIRQLSGGNFGAEIPTFDMD